MLIIILRLYSPPSGSLRDSVLHGISLSSGVHDHRPVDIPGRPAAGLNQRSFRTEKTGPVGIQNSHQGYLGNVQPFPEEIDPDQDIKLPQTQLPDNLGSSHGLDIRMKILNPDPFPFIIFRQFFRHSLGQGGHQDPFILLHPEPDLSQKIIHLILSSSNQNRRIDQPRGPDNLLYYCPPAPFHFIFSRCSGNIDSLMDPILKLREIQGSIIKGGGEPESKLNQSLLPGTIPPRHPPDLGDGDMALIDKEQEIIREVIKQSGRRIARFSVVKMKRIILNPITEPDLLHHLQVIVGAHLQPLDLQQLSPLFKELQSSLQFHADISGRAFQIGFAADIMTPREDNRPAAFPRSYRTERINIGEPFNLIPPIFNPQDPVFLIGGKYLHHIPPNPKGTPVEIKIVSLILEVNQILEETAAGILIARLELNNLIPVFLGGTEAIDTGYAGNDNNIPSGPEGIGGRVPHPVDLFINGRVFLDITIGRGEIGFRLIVVVITDKILHRVLGEELRKLSIELSR